MSTSNQKIRPNLSAARRSGFASCVPATSEGNRLNRKLELFIRQKRHRFRFAGYRLRRASRFRFVRAARSAPCAPRPCAPVRPGRRRRTASRTPHLETRRWLECGHQPRFAHFPVIMQVLPTHIHLRSRLSRTVFRCRFADAIHFGAAGQRAPSALRNANEPHGNSNSLRSACTACVSVSSHRPIPASLSSSP